MSDVLYIDEGATRRNLTLEREGRIPRTRRELSGRVYSELDPALPRAKGEGRHQRRPRGFEGLPGATL